MDVIKIKIQDLTRTIDLEIPPKASLLKEVLGNINTEKKYEEHNKISLDKEDVYEEIYDVVPKTLKSVKGFKKVYSQLNNTYPQKHAFTATIPNKVQLELTGTKHVLDKISFIKQLNKDLENIHKKHVKAIVINVMSNIAEEDMAYIYDMTAQLFPFITVIKYFKKTKFPSTKMDVLMFGNELYKENPFFLMFK